MGCPNGAGLILQVWNPGCMVPSSSSLRLVGQSSLLLWAVPWALLYPSATWPHGGYAKPRSHKCSCWWCCQNMSLQVMIWRWWLKLGWQVCVHSLVCSFGHSKHGSSRGLSHRLLGLTLPRTCWWLWRFGGCHPELSFPVCLWWFLAYVVESRVGGSLWQGHVGIWWMGGGTDP